MCWRTWHLSDSFGITHYLEVFQGQWDQRCRQKLSLLYVLILCPTHHSSWQCKESHCCCHGPLVLLAMEDFGTSTVLTRYENMRLQSLRQSERTTVREPVQCKRWTNSRYRAVKTERQQISALWWCTRPFKHLAKAGNNGAAILKVYKCCTPVNKAMSEILNWR